MNRLKELLGRLDELLPPDQRAVGPVLRAVVEAALEDLERYPPVEELRRLERTLARLAEQTEHGFQRVWQAIQQLAEAQRRTEERLNRLEATVQQLAEAQRRTEERLNRLEATVQQLAEAQRRTEEELRQLAAEHRKTREQLGGLSVTVGYVLENEAFKALPRLLERDHGLRVQGRLRRTFVTDARGVPVEVNIFGTALRDGQEVTIIGEAKAQLSRRKVDEFARKLKRLRDVFPEVVPLIVTHMISQPEVEGYVRQKGFLLYYSYEF